MFLNLYTLRLDIRQSNFKLESCRKTVAVVYFSHRRIILSIGRAENLEKHHSWWTDSKKKIEPETFQNKKLQTCKLLLLFRAKVSPISLHQPPISCTVAHHIRIWSKSTESLLKAFFHPRLSFPTGLLPRKDPPITVLGIGESSILTTWPAHCSLIRYKKTANVRIT